MTEYDSISKSELDRLGSRLRNSPEPTDDDLVLLNRYRERFIEVTNIVVDQMRTIAPYPIESRHKSIPSIIAKLRRRQPARLSAMQDLAGARVIVRDSAEQDDLLHRIVAHYPAADVDDKRDRPSFGYRAVHVVLHTPLAFEIQVRTEIQHAWAQLSERLADRYGFELKYGGGPDDVRAALLEYAEYGAVAERVSSKAGVDPDAVGLLAPYLERLSRIMETLRVE